MKTVYSLNYSSIISSRILFTKFGYEFIDGVTFLQRIIYILSTFALLLSFAVFYIVISEKSLRNPNAILMLHLSAIDIKMAIFSIIGMINIDVTGFVSKNICLSQALFLPQIGGLTLFSIFLLNLDRYIAIVKPFKYKSYVNYKTISLSLIIGWSCMFLPKLTFTMEEVALNVVTVQCIREPISNPKLWIAGTTIVYAFLSIILCIFYGHLFLIQRKFNKIGNFHKIPSKLRSGIKNKGLITTSLILLSFYASFSPKVVDILLKSLQKSYNPYFDFIGFSLVLTYASISNLLYGGTNKEFKYALSLKLKKVFNIPNSLSSSQNIFRISSASHNIHCSSNQ